MPTLWSRLVLRILHPQRLLRDLLVWVLAVPLAYLLRFDGSIDLQFRAGLEAYLLWGTLVKVAAVFAFRLYATSYRKASFRDIGVLVFAVGTVTLASLVIVALLRPDALVPRSIPLIEGVLALLLLFGARAFGRAVDEWQRKGQATGATGVLIVGAGEAGNLLVREMARHPELGLNPIGFVDDDPEKQGLTYAGAKVLGNLSSIETLIQTRPIDEVVIAIPSADGAFVRQTLQKVQEASQGAGRPVKTRVIPGVYELLTGDVSLQRIREVQVEDLLRRKPVELDMKGIRSIIEGRSVWVTGAGGSIGSEITRQLLSQGAQHLLLIDQAENNLFELEQELRRLPVVPPFTLALASVQDLPKLRRLAQAHPPQLIFHAAAHKHVPIIEAHPEEAVRNNILGTSNVAEVALEFGTERLVNISTDKAINPTSVMGASKRVAEVVVKEAGKRATPHQRFVSVRFGNVLGSRGSVVPIFKEQISRGGPVTITDKRMTRYFMTIPEASQLVLQAAAIAENEAVYFLDMGDPVKILDLAEDLIRLSGLEPYVDIDIQEVGMRPGEKLFEELTTTQAAASTSHPQIFVANGDGLGDSSLGDLMADAVAFAEEGNAEGLKHLLQQVVPGGQLELSAAVG